MAIWAPLLCILPDMNFWKKTSMILKFITPSFPQYVDLSMTYTVKTAHLSLQEKSRHFELLPACVSVQQGANLLCM